MRKAIAIIILIGLGALIWFNPGVYNTKTIVDRSEYDSRIEEDEILKMAKEDSEGLKKRIIGLQATPEQVVGINAKIMKVMYSGDLSEDEIKLLGTVQRYYYHEDLLAQNPEVLHLKSMVSDVRKAVEEENWIVDYKVYSTQYDPDDPTIATVLVGFSPNSTDPNDDIIMRYLLERSSTEVKDESGEMVDKSLWYIIGWVGADASEITVIE